MRNGALTWMFIALALLLAVPVQAADTVYYYSSDTLHSEVVVTDQNRNVVERTTHYAPYGQVLNRDLRDGPGYTGHEEDPETSLVYMQQRYYDPEAGRFLSTDPVQADGGGGSFNRYEYANDNPYRYTDPDGRMVWTDWNRGQQSGFLCQEDRMACEYALASGKQKQKQAFLTPIPPLDNGSGIFGVVAKAIATDVAYIQGMVTGNQPEASSFFRVTQK